jgi:hypothetical protein
LLKSGRPFKLAIDDGFFLSLEFESSNGTPFRGLLIALPESFSLFFSAAIYLGLVLRVFFREFSI